MIMKWLKTFIVLDRSYKVFLELVYWWKQFEESRNYFVLVPYYLELLMGFKRRFYNLTRNCLNDESYAVWPYCVKKMLVNTKLLPFVSQCGHFKHGLQCLDWILCIVCPACEQWIVVVHTTLWDKQYLFIITVFCYDEKPQTFLRHLKFCSLFKWFLVCQMYCYMKYYISKYKENFNGIKFQLWSFSSIVNELFDANITEKGKFLLL